MEHDWWVKRSVLPLFDEGKELEIRVKTRFSVSVLVGDVIIFSLLVRRRVVAIRKYASFEAMLEKEDPGKILPKASASQVLRILRNIYSPEKERRGVYVFQLSEEAV